MEYNGTTDTMVLSVPVAPERVTKIRVAHTGVIIVLSFVVAQSLLQRALHELTVMADASKGERGCRYQAGRRSFSLPDALTPSAPALGFKMGKNWYSRHRGKLKQEAGPSPKRDRTKVGILE